VIFLSSYTIAWLVYLLSSIGAMIVFWRLTRNLKWRRTKRVLRICVAVTLLTPMNIVAGSLWLAPAFLVAAYALAQAHMETVNQALTVMSGAVGVMILVVLLESVGRRLLGLRYGE
jgi:membrane-associated HD superfamily phosphohydrolase